MTNPNYEELGIVARDTMIECGVRHIPWGTSVRDARAAIEGAKL